MSEEKKEEEMTREEWEVLWGEETHIYPYVEEVQEVDECKEIEQKIMSLVKEVENHAKWVEYYGLFPSKTQMAGGQAMYEKHKMELEQAKGAIERLLNELAGCELKKLYG